MTVCTGHIGYTFRFLQAGGLEAVERVCRAFGISRKTDYKILERYKEHGPKLERLNRHWDWRRNAAQQEIFY